MKPTVIKVDVENINHRDDLQRLYREYVSLSDTSIDNNLVDKLCKLPYFKGFICYQGDVALGFSTCFESFSSYQCQSILNVHDFMISTNHQGGGLGRLLMTAIEEFCRENNYLKLTLEVNETNTNAMKLYASFGFKDYRETRKEQLHWQKYLS